MTQAFWLTGCRSIAVTGDPQLAGPVLRCGSSEKQVLTPVGEGYQVRSTLAPIPLLLLNIPLSLVSFPEVWGPHDVIWPRQLQTASKKT